MFTISGWEDKRLKDRKKLQSLKTRWPEGDSAKAGDIRLPPHLGEIPDQLIGSVLTVQQLLDLSLAERFGPVQQRRALEDKGCSFLRAAAPLPQEAPV